MSNDNNKDPLVTLTEIEAKAAEIKDNVHRAEKAKSDAGFFKANPEKIEGVKKNVELVDHVHATIVRVKNQALSAANATEATADNAETTAASSGHRNP